MRERDIFRFGTGMVSLLFSAYIWVVLNWLQEPGLLQEKKYPPNGQNSQNEGDHAEGLDQFSRPAHRISLTRCSWSSGRFSHFWPHPGQSPRQSSLQSGLVGIVKITASRMGASRSIKSPSIQSCSSSSPTSTSTGFLPLLFLPPFF